MIQGKNWKVFQGSNLDVLPTLEDNSIDAIVTDPPYELGFMGKKWDSSGIAYNIELWRECLRVLKPGGHLLSFGGSRTWHRIAVAIEDAGFEVRDSIAWMYGSGFPKSLDISKAIDKRGGVTAQQSEFAKALQTAKNKTSLTIADLNEILGKRTSNLWSHFVGDVQPQLPSVENYWKLKDVLPIEDKWDSWFQAEAEREVIGQNKKAELKDSVYFGNLEAAKKSGRAIGYGEFDITAPATPEAQQWEGWGTALKPAFEPVIVARKPLIGTVAENVLTYGTGGLNIDGSRITHNGRRSPAGADGTVKRTTGNTYSEATTGEQFDTNKGRWPANVILDSYAAELLDEQSGITKSGKSGLRTSDGFNANAYGKGMGIKAGQDNGEYGDTGGASRFFYVAKASKRDRNEGLEELEETTAAEMVDREPDSAGMNSPRAGAGRTSGAKNFHPTVKPTDLMRYLIKLVTPPGGVVLDPFTGSGSTGKAAILEGFSFIGIELTEEYLPIIEGRLKWAEEQRNLAEAKKDEALF